MLLLLVGLVTVLAAAAAWWVQRPDEPLGPDGPCGPPVRKDGAPQAPKFDNVVSGPVLAWVPPPVPKAIAAPPQGAQAATQPPVETRAAGRPAP